MKCEEIAELLPDYLQEGLRVEQKKIVERHLESCAECSEVAGLWKKLALIPDEQPSAAGRERFEAMLQAYQTGRGEEGVTRRAPERGASVWSVFPWLRSPVGAVRAGNVPGTATREREIEFAGFGGSAHGADQHAADGCAVDVTAAIGEPTVGRRDVDAARGAT